MKISQLTVAGVLCVALTAYGRAAAEPVKKEAVKTKKEQLLAEFIEASYKPIIDTQLDSVAQQVKSSIGPGLIFRGQDISTESFWQPVLAEYAGQKQELTAELYREIEAYLAEQYTEAELAEVLAILNSPVFKKMIATRFDVKSPVYGDRLDKLLRRGLYKIVYRKVKEDSVAKSAVPGRASED